jgi:hypothetical protein
VSAGAIELNGSTLYTGEPPAAIPAGTVVTLISNSTGKAVSGTFAGLPQGATEDGYRISYDGGTSRQDVTLTVVRPITIASPAHASPNIVLGNSTALTSLGTTSSGQSGLTYHWAVVASPPGAPKPTLSANGIAAARRVVATFGKAGYYRFRCTISDGEGDTAASDVSVEVKQTATALRIEPHGTHIAENATLQYKGTVLDQFNHPMRTAHALTFLVATGPGSITPTGLFSATSIAGQVEIELEADDLTGTVGLQVIS